jgi:hypothetical protein
VLKRVFVAPDPGRTRLRFATRAVLGIALAGAVCGLAGHSLTGAVTGGLAALLALFTVTDATVRGQAVTTIEGVSTTRGVPNGRRAVNAERTGVQDARIRRVGRLRQARARLRTPCSRRPREGRRR